MRNKVAQKILRASKVERITVGQQQSGDSIDSRPVQIWPKDSFVIAAAAAIQKPISSRSPNVDGGIRADIQHCDLRG